MAKPNRQRRTAVKAAPKAKPAPRATAKPAARATTTKAKPKPKANPRARLEQIADRGQQLQESQAASQYSSYQSKELDAKLKKRAAAAFEKAKRHAMIAEARKAGIAAGKAAAAGTTATDTAQLRRSARQQELAAIAQQQQIKGRQA